MKTEFIKNPQESDILRAAEIIKKGGLVAFPTETVYGLGASALDESAAEKIYRAKGRPSDNPLIIHLATAEDAEKYANTSECFYKIAKLFMPGPVTVILPKKKIIPSSVTGGLDTVAVRVPSNRIARRLIELAGLPIAAPSANLSGRPSCTTAAHIKEDMNGRIDMILDGGSAEFGLESTILLPIDKKSVKLLRPGAVTVEMLTEAGFEVSIDKAVTQKLSDGEKPLAPGMKYRHYAPKAQVILLNGSREAVMAYMSLKATDKGAAFICYDESKGSFNSDKVFYIGGEKDFSYQAHELFSILRKLDEDSNVDTVYAPMPSKEDVGLAIYNRLLKASGYTVLNI